ETAAPPRLLGGPVDGPDAAPGDRRAGGAVADRDRARRRTGAGPAGGRPLRRAGRRGDRRAAAGDPHRPAADRAAGHHRAGHPGADAAVVPADRGPAGHRGRLRHRGQHPRRPAGQGQGLRRLLHPHPPVRDRRGVRPGDRGEPARRLPVGPVADRAVDRGGADPRGRRARRRPGPDRHHRVRAGGVRAGGDPDRRRRRRDPQRRRDQPAADQGGRRPLARLPAAGGHV
ncbi:MAG: hypothetical protein AVDCRST_MAG41-3483, partial [uncultured Corynebacteriales bacterium]